MGIETALADTAPEHTIEPETRDAVAPDAGAVHASPGRIDASSDHVAARSTPLVQTEPERATSPRARFLAACADAIASGDTKLAKIAHKASGVLLDDADAGERGADVADLDDARRARRSAP